MEFWDLVNEKDEHLADIIEFDDGVFVLKFNVFGKVYCFKTFDKLIKYIDNLRLTGRLIKNGVDEDSYEE